MDLTLDLVEEEHTISGSMEFATDLFAQSAMERMARHSGGPACMQMMAPVHHANLRHGQKAGAPATPSRDCC